MHELQSQIAPYFAHGMLAIFGALVHATKSYREGKSKTPVDFLALIIMSSFSGVMFALVGLEAFGTDSYLTMAMAGTGGFVGVEGMTFVIGYVSKRFKI
jgi:hypothetical protein